MGQGVGRGRLARSGRAPNAKQKSSYLSVGTEDPREALVSGVLLEDHRGRRGKSRGQGTRYMASAVDQGKCRC